MGDWYPGLGLMPVLNEATGCRLVVDDVEDISDEIGDMKR